MRLKLEKMAANIQPLSSTAEPTKEAVKFWIADPKYAVLHCLVLLCKGLRFEDPILLAELVTAGIITHYQNEELHNPMTARKHRWGILSQQLLSLQPGEVKTFFKIILRVEGAIDGGIRDELLKKLQQHERE